jgi:hypothetical protein
MEQKLGEAVRAVLAEAKEPLSPSQIRDIVKDKYPHLYQTEAHRIGIEKGNYQNFDHALLNPIYSLVTQSSDFVIDRRQRPMLISLAGNEIADEVPEEDYEAEFGIVYVLDTGLFTDKHQRIIKIGHTTQNLDARIAQLYTTGTPFQFKKLHSWRVKNYTELEQALHRLLVPFRINRGREFFTEDALPHVEAIVKIHNDVQSQVLINR